MNQAELNGIVTSTVANLNSLLTIKGGEYANSDDRLANFKRGAALVGLQPLQVLFVYLSKHYDAVASYVRKSASGERIVLSEPIEGRLDDIIVYCTLAKAIISEAKQAALADRDSEQHGNRLFGISTDSEVLSPVVGVPSERK